MLDERKALILRAVVTDYIETAQPVGSGQVARSPGIGVSSATIRNDMAALEAEGYLAQPHTSAGRIPTEKGYRFFVDQLGGPGRLGAPAAQQVRRFFSQTHGRMEEMLADTSRLLSSLTHYAAVVVAPQHEVATVRSVQLVALGPRLILGVFVLSTGAIERVSIEMARDVDELEVNAASVRLSSLVVGRSLDAVADLPPSPADDDTAELLDATVSSLRHELGHDDQVFIGGTSEMVSSFDAVRTVSEILRILEQQIVVVSLLEDVLDRGLSVAIGRETGNEALSDCSIVVAPYLVDGEAAGTIGVLGPTRMQYDQTLSAVAVVADRLGRSLSEG